MGYSNYPNGSNHAYVVLAFFRTRTARSTGRSHRRRCDLLWQGLHGQRMDRIEIVKNRLPAKFLVTVAHDMHVPRERLYAWIGIARTTANRKVNSNESLNQDESERALGIASLVGQVQKIVAESGQPDGFDAARWTADWLAESNPALGGRDGRRIP